MKKWKIITLLIGAIIMFSKLSGCGEIELSFTVLDLATVSDGIGELRTCEVPEWSYEQCNPHEDASAPAEMTVTFNGKTYTGTYIDSFTTIPNTFASHHYKVDTKDGTVVSFDTNAQTGALTRFSLYNKAKNEVTMDETDCRKIADGLAKEYISLKDYKVKTEGFYDNTAFAYTYYREVSGYETTDSIRIFVDGDGTVTNCDVSMAGTFQDVKKIVIDEEKAITAIDAKIQEIYGHLDTMTGYTIRRTQWVKAPNGQYGRLYRIDVDFRDGSSSYGAIVNLLLV